MAVHLQNKVANIAGYAFADAIRDRRVTTSEMKRWVAELKTQNLPADSLQLKMHEEFVMSGPKIIAFDEGAKEEFRKFMAEVRSAAPASPQLDAARRALEKHVAAEKAAPGELFRIEHAIAAVKVKGGTIELTVATNGAVSPAEVASGMEAVLSSLGYPGIDVVAVGS